MGEPRKLGDLLAVAPIVPAARARASQQGDLFSADATWFPVLRALFQAGTMARLGPYAIAAYLAIKARANLGTGKATVSISTVARDTGMSDRAAREAVRRLEQEGLVSSDVSNGRRTIYQLVERLQIVDGAGSLVGAVEWPFSATTWGEQLKRVIAAAIDQLASGRPQTTINIGAINILVVPGHRGDEAQSYAHGPVDRNQTSAPGAEVGTRTPAPHAEVEPGPRHLVPPCPPLDSLDKEVFRCSEAVDNADGSPSPLFPSDGPCR